MPESHAKLLLKETHDQTGFKMMIELRRLTGTKARIWRDETKQSEFYGNISGRTNHVACCVFMATKNALTKSLLRYGRSFQEPVAKHQSCYKNNTDIAAAFCRECAQKGTFRSHRAQPNKSVV